MMPRVKHVKKARKDNDAFNIKKGNSYYHWKFRNGGKQCSLTYPKPSQLTQSPFLKSIYQFQYDLEGLQNPTTEWVEEFTGSLEELRDECQGSFDNIPEQLQYAPVGELLTERIDFLDNAINEFSNIEVPEEVNDPGNEPVEVDHINDDAFQEAYDLWQEESDNYQEYIQAMETILEEIQAIEIGG